MPGAGVPACMAVPIAGKGSLNPPAVPRWGGRGNLGQGDVFGAGRLQGFDAVPQSRAKQIPGTRLQDTAPLGAGEAKQQKKLFVSLMASARSPAGKGKVRGHLCAS